MKRPDKPKIGSKIPTWFSNQPDGMSKVTAVRQYLGRYPQHFTWIVTATAPTTVRGVMDFAI